jgi:hypothetical protein
MAAPLFPPNCLIEGSFYPGIIEGGWRFDREKGKLKVWIATITLWRIWDRRKKMEVRSRIHGWALDLMERKGLTERYDVDPLDHGYDH